MRKPFVWITFALAVAEVSLVAIALLQQITWGGPDIDEGSGVAAAFDGSVFVTGTTQSFGAGSRDAFLLKFALDGSLVWQRTYGTAPTAFTTGDEFGQSVAAAPDGSAYITGEFGDGNLFLAKFDPAGTLLWQRTWGDNGTIGNAVKVAADGSVYVAGFTFTFGVGQGDALLLKYVPDGTLVWARTWGGAGFDSARDLAIGSDGGIYIAGDTNSFFANDAFLAKFDASGNVVWDRDWGTTNSSGTDAQTVAFGVGAAPDGSIYITGNSFGTGASETVILVRFDAGGTLISESLTGPTFGTGHHVAIGADGTVYVTGNTDPSVDAQSFVAKILPSGKERETRAWGGAEPESGEGIAIAPNGSIVVAGSAGAPPYTFRKVPNKTVAPNAFLITPGGTVTVPAGAVATPAGVVTSPNGSLTFGGVTDAFLLRLQQ